jgi:hypothetical protein
MIRSAPAGSTPGFAASPAAPSTTRPGARQDSFRCQAVGNLASATVFGDRCAEAFWPLAAVPLAVVGLTTVVVALGPSPVLGELVGALSWRGRTCSGCGVRSDARSPARDERVVRDGWVRAPLDLIDCPRTVVLVSRPVGGTQLLIGSDLHLCTLVDPASPQLVLRSKKNPKETGGFWRLVPAPGGQLAWR